MRFILPLLITLALLISNADGAEATYQTDGESVLKTELSGSAFDSEYRKLRRSGYRLTDIDTHFSGNRVRYSQVWSRSSDRRAWVGLRDLSDVDFNSKSRQYKRNGYRLVDLETYTIRGQRVRAAIWIKNNERFEWDHEADLTVNQFNRQYESRKADGYHLVDLDTFESSTGTKYTTIWVKSRNSVISKSVLGINARRFMTTNAAFRRDGFVPFDIEFHKRGSTELVSGIWRKEVRFTTGLTFVSSKRAFDNQIRRRKDDGFRPIDLERSGSGSNVRYGAVWIENAASYKNPAVREVDDMIRNYVRANSIPGLSVVVFKDGKAMYRKGFGWADVRGEKVAHAGTIFGTASIAKVVTGTIAAKLHSFQRLHDRTPVKFNIKAKTKSYLTRIQTSEGTTVSIPAKHEHTVEQLFSHLGCVKHYDGPSPARRHYSKAIDALTQIWDEDLLTGCRPGNSRNYSTHGFTYIGAVLEKVTGRSSARLVQTEISKPYDLKTLRAVWGTRRVPNNYERAKRYRDNGSEIPFTNTSRNDSWKTLGGNLEVSTLDLARFGEKVRSGEILVRSRRELLLWKRVNPNRTNGIGWIIRNRDGSRVAEHDGKGRGIRTLLRVYRDRPFVIAIMSNRENHPSGNINRLASVIAGRLQ